MRIVLLFSLLILVSCNNGNKNSDSTATNEAVVEKTGEENVVSKKHPAEDSITFYLSEIARFRADNELDSLDNMNVVLMTYIKTLCKDESMLQYTFEELGNTGMQILTSDDDKFRIYCWDTETGGSMHYYNAIAQYKTETGSSEYILNDIYAGKDDCGFWYSELYTVPANSNKTYYLPVYYGTYSGMEHSNGIDAYVIEGNKLNNKTRIFKPVGKPLDNIFYDYIIGTETKESADNHISLSNDEKTLSIPITDEDRVITNRSLIYKFDGDKFVYDKSAH